MCLFKCKSFPCGHPGFFELLEQCSSGSAPTGADEHNAGLYPSHACTGTQVSIGEITPVEQPRYCQTCHHIIIDRMRNFQHPIIWGLTQGFQASISTQPPADSPFLEPWIERVQALDCMDKEKQQEELAPLSRWQRYWWKRYNRYVPSLESRSMTPGEWSAEDERELLRWRLARFMEKQGTVEGYGKFNGEELLRRGEDRSSSDYP